MSQQGVLTDSGTALADIETLTGDAGGAIGPDAAGNVNLLGTAAQGISTSGAGNTITWTIADATDAQKGVSELATDAEAIAGADTSRPIVATSLKAKLGTQTANSMPYGAGDAAAIAWTAAPTDGQILIGATGLAPALATLTAGSGISITNGANSITISEDGALEGTGTTVGAVTSDLITVGLGGSAASYRFHALITGYDAGNAEGYGYTIDASVRTDGAAGTIIDVINRDADEDDTAAQATITVSGNNAIVRVTGVAGNTINWNSRIEYISVS